MNNYQKDGCLTCGTFPYIDTTGMCATCTFGEADAQQELIGGEMEGAVWEKPKAKKRKKTKAANESLKRIRGDL